MTGARFQQIADDLRERIALGDVGAGAGLESEAVLGRRYDASRMTVRKALETLRDEGLVHSRQGAGWFATAGSFHQALAVGSFRHAPSAVTSAGQSLSRRVVSFGFVPAPAHIAALLAIGTGDDVLVVRSVRSADGVPLERATEWVAANTASTLSRADATDPGVWQSLDRAGHRIGSVHQRIAAGVAGPTDTDLLGTPTGSPLLLIRRIARSADPGPGQDRPVLAVSDHRYLAHRFSLEVEFSNWSGLADSPPGLREEPA